MLPAPSTNPLDFELSRLSLDRVLVLSSNRKCPAPVVIIAGIAPTNPERTAPEQYPDTTSGRS